MNSVDDNNKSSRPTILTNMVFWQSPEWAARTDSIYPDHGRQLTVEETPWWQDAWRLFLQRSRYDTVVTMGARASLAYGLLCALTGRSSRQIMTEVFIDQDQSNRPGWKIKTALYRWISRRAIGMLTNSSAEVESLGRRFHIPPDRCIYVPMHTNIEKPAFSESDEGYILSAGRTLRDYDLLLKAVEDLNCPVIIIGGAADLVSKKLPPNVTILREIGRAQYLDHVKRCRAVALPLHPTERSTGQVVLLEAMAFGKPVVASDTPGTRDHITNGVNGYLVPPGDLDALKSRLTELAEQPDRCRQLGRHALDTIINEASISRHTQLKLTAIRDLWLRSQYAAV